MQGGVERSEGSTKIPGQSDAESEQRVHASEETEEEAERDKVKLRERINTVEMESNAVELDLKQYTEEEQEAMVSNDVMRLEIKRLA